MKHSIQETLVQAALKATEEESPRRSFGKDCLVKMLYRRVHYGMRYGIRDLEPTYIGGAVHQGRELGSRGSERKATSRQLPVAHQLRRSLALPQEDRGETALWEGMATGFMMKINR